MLRFLHREIVPPGGYPYIVKETGLRIHSNNLMETVALVRKHRDSRGLGNPPNLAADIEDWICRQPGVECVDDKTGKASSHAGHKFSAAKTVNFTLTLVRRARALMIPPVDNIEANRRASICVACTNNVPIVGCMNCTGISSMIEGMTRGRSTQYDKKLHICSLNGELNAVHVFLGERVLAESMKATASYPESCWKRAITKLEVTRDVGHDNRLDGSGVTRSRVGHGHSKVQRQRSAVARRNFRAWPRSARRGCSHCGRH